MSLNLDKLLRQALSHQARARLTKHIERVKKDASLDWTEVDPVELIWSPSRYALPILSLGTFRVLVHIRGARRLVKMESPPESPSALEWVWGEHWLAPPAPVERTPSEEEMIALRARARELLREFEESL